MYSNDSITILTSDVLRVHMSSPSDKGLTVQQKADVHQENILWARIPSDPFSLLLTSPRSRKQYRLSLNPTTGTVSCSCPCKVTCYHIVCFERDWKPLLMAQAKVPAPSVKPSVYSAYVPATRHAETEAQFAALWKD